MERSNDEEVLKAFDALGPDGAFALVTAHEPLPLLQKLQARRPGAFEWNVLEAGPARFRVELVRRARAGPREISEYLERDHRRLDALFARVCAGVQSGELSEAARAFGEFELGLTRHIEREERVLFPLFEEATDFRNGPTRVMRAEHLEIRRLLEELADALKRENGPAFERYAEELTGTLEQHNAKEENILYPESDAALDVEARDAVVRQMQAM